MARQLPPLPPTPCSGAAAGASRRRPAKAAAVPHLPARRRACSRIDIRSVREIIQHGPMTAGAADAGFVRGVINLRGAVVPVIDLQARFGQAPAAAGQEDLHRHLRGARAGERVELGLLVDAVSEVVDIPAAEIEPPPNFGGAVRRDFIQRHGQGGPALRGHPRAGQGLRRRRDGAAVPTRHPDMPKETFKADVAAPSAVATSSAASSRTAPRTARPTMWMR
jgi:chemotaxis signal transduction protein